MSARLPKSSGGARASYNRVADELRASILAGTLSPGDRLLAEDDLASAHGVGRSTAREALRLLVAEGLLITLRGATGGTFVSQPEPELISERMHTALRLLTATEKVTVEQLIATREALELPAIRAATRLGGAADLERLALVIPRPEAALQQGVIYESNRDFHQVIFDLCGNPLLAATADPIFTILRHRFLREAASPSFWRQVAADHRRILGAMQRRDPDAAAEAMSAHLHRLRRTYVRIDTAGGRPKAQ